ncbi:MAG TPA: hypothetical protein VE464_08475 [Streptosporangiaceae bacterium]|nr:hypothetical protein [Streptosporangiaceae bacterium]
MDKKTLHESLPDHEFGQLQTDAEKGSNGGREYPRDAQAGPVPAEDQLRHDVLTRVVRISRALNQRLAL